jgi:predicted permease
MIVSPGFFPAVGGTILRGRDFTESDNSPDSPRVAIISRAMAQKYWPSESPLGKQLGVGPPYLPNLTIIGIAADIKHLSLREDPSPEMYVLYTQKPFPSMQNMHIVMRTEMAADLIAENARKTVNTVDPELPLAKLTALSQVVRDALVPARFSMLLLAFFGGLALLLACIGMYGTISYFVTQRTQEIGVRMALGAQRRSIFATILGEGARITWLGIILGLAAALFLNRAMAAFLYGVASTDLTTFLGTSVLLSVVAFLACYFPARRATSVDPMIALREG